MKATSQIVVRQMFATLQKILQTAAGEPELPDSMLTNRHINPVSSDERGVQAAVGPVLTALPSTGGVLLQVGIVLKVHP